MVGGVERSWESDGGCRAGRGEVSGGSGGAAAADVMSGPAEGHHVPQGP